LARALKTFVQEQKIKNALTPLSVTEVKKENEYGKRKY